VASTSEEAHSVSDTLLKRLRANASAVVHAVRTYVLALSITLALYMRYFAHGKPTLLMCLLAAAIGVAGMVVVDIGINARFLLANRKLAKNRRRWASRHKPPSASA
jgi:hypothetical protein